MTRHRSGKIRLLQTLSKCDCPAELYYDRFMICTYAKQWIDQVEQHTAMTFDYARSASVFERVQ